MTLGILGRRRGEGRGGEGRGGEEGEGEEREQREGGGKEGIIHAMTMPDCSSLVCGELEASIYKEYSRYTKVLQQAEQWKTTIDYCA